MDSGNSEAIPLTPISESELLDRETGSDALIERFSGTERAVHWTYALFFLLLMATGLSMEVPVLSALFPDRYLLRQIHFASAFFFVVGPVLVALVGDWRIVATTASEFDAWDEDDRNWLSDVWNGMRTEPDRFNAGQKLNGIFTIGAALLFTITGLIMLSNVYGRLFPLWLVTNAAWVHDVLTWLALLAWCGHIFLALIYPPTRPSLRGMTLGSVRASWAAEHHAKWHRRVIAHARRTP